MSYISKYLNAILNGSSYLASSLLQRPFISGMPVAIGIELTNHCNLRCPECPSGSGKMKRARGFMDKDLFVTCLEQLRPYLFNANLYFQGEPMLHPGFFELLGHAEEIPVTISTNGHFLSQENSLKLASSSVRTLLVSLDGMDQAVYSSYRINGDIEKVKEGLINLSKAKVETRSKIRIVIQVLVNKKNEFQVPEIGRLAEDIGAKLVLKSMQVYNESAMEEWLPENERYRRYKRESGHFRIKSSSQGSCSRLWFNPVITWDGKVVPCCFDKDGSYVMGDMNTQTFYEIWHGKIFYEFRRIVLSDRSKIPICGNCTSGLSGIKT